MKLSILICTIPSRFHLLKRLYDSLAPQLTPEVEVLWLGDNKRRSIGEKRNSLLSIASGDYFAFIDDDDQVTSDYVSSILGAMADSPDVICFQTITHNGDTGTHKINLVGMQYEYHESADLVTCPPTHTMAWRRSLVWSIDVDGEFPDKSEGEDVDWVLRMRKLVKTQATIDKVLYHYDFDRKVSERP